MNKQSLINELEFIKEVIIKYFNKTGTEQLAVLDGDSRKYVDSYTGYEISGYTGVTIKYLREYLFDKKYSNAMVTYVMLQLLLKGEIRTLYCCDIKRVIFEPIKSTHGSHYFIEDHFDDGRCITTSDRYKSIVKTYNGINNYLNK